MKTNFKKSDTPEEASSVEEKQDSVDDKEITQKEFEEFIIKSGAKGSFMVYRSDKEDEELGMDEL